MKKQNVIIFICLLAISLNSCGRKKIMREETNINMKGMYRTIRNYNNYHQTKNTFKNTKELWKVSAIMPYFIDEEIFYKDAWGSFMEIQETEGSIILRSFGPNQIDDKGSHDDITKEFFHIEYE